MTKILDCTIRDGGHLNCWNFSFDFVKNAYKCALKSNVDYFETGYRFKHTPSDGGYFARCEDSLLSKLFTPSDTCKITVMVESDNFDINDFSPCNADFTPVRAVRVASYPDDLKNAFLYCEMLKDKGYEVFLNLMAVSRYNNEDFDVLCNMKNKDILEALVFADSFGSFTPEKVEYFMKQFSASGFAKIGFHAHNNLQNAHANTLKAVECNAFSVDASAFGMGRGAGNVPVELLLGVLNSTAPKHYAEFVEKYLYEEMKKTPWGYDILSFISGLNDIHPYYIKSLVNDYGFTAQEAIETAHLIKAQCPVSFDRSALEPLLKKH